MEMFRALLINRWDKISTGFWFLPLLMLSVTLFATQLLYWVDQQAWLDGAGIKLWWQDDPQGALAILGTIAASMATIAGVVFSITMVVLSLASQQFGPRMIRNFMEDRGDQFVLGSFLCTFLFCILVIAQVDSSEASPYVPQLSVTVALIAAAFNVGVLIYFIHHVALMIQASQVIAGVAEDAFRAIANQGNDFSDADVLTDQAAMPDFFAEKSLPIRAESCGYIQTIAYKSMLSLATAHQARLELLVEPGDFLLEGQQIARVSPLTALDSDLASKFMQALVLGSRRTPVQDSQFAIQQVTEIAVRAMSPGINDPFTAINCIDTLSAIIADFSRRPVKRNLLVDEKGEVRVKASMATFNTVVDAAIEPLRACIAPHAIVVIRLLEVCGQLSNSVHGDEQREHLISHVESLAALAAQRLCCDRDQSKVAQAAESALASLSEQDCI